MDNGAHTVVRHLQAWASSTRIAALLIIAAAIVAADYQVGERAEGFKEDCFVGLTAELPDGVRIGDQVRIVHGADFTICTLRRDEQLPATSIVLSTAGLQRARLTTGCNVTLAPALGAKVDPAAAQQHGEGYEVLLGDQTTASVLFLVPHGGFIEVGTDRIAELLAGDDDLPAHCAAWIFRGFRPGGGAYDRWHITSTAISTRSFPALGRITSDRRYRLAIALHGHRGDAILIGGNAPATLKSKLAGLIGRTDLPAAVEIRDRGQPLAGASKHNIVNRFSDHGLQLELPKVIRTEHAAVVANILQQLISD